MSLMNAQLSTAEAEIEAIPSVRGASTVAPRVGVWRLVSFFALMGVLVVAANATISVGLRHLRTTTYGDWNRAMQGQANADIVISGSSRAAYHYDPRVIQTVTGHSAFNLGRNGSQTDVQLAVLNAYLEHNRKPELIVHNLDAFSFVTTREVFDPPLYVPYLDDPALYQPLRRIDPSFVRSRYIPLYGYVVEDMNFAWVLGLRSLVGLAPHNDSYAGFTPQNRRWTEDFAKFRESNPDGVTFPVEPAGVKVLVQLMQLCHDRGIPLIFVYSPEYSEMQEMTKNRPEIFAEFRTLAAQYHVPLWDYSEWKYDGDRNYFYNSQHLNATGAHLFSEEVSARLRSWIDTSLPQDSNLRAAAQTR